MSALSETIQYTQLATTGCQETVGTLARAGEQLLDVERALRAGLDGTEQIAEAGQYHQLASNAVTGAQQAVLQLQQHLEGLVAQFHR